MVSLFCCCFHLKETKRKHFREQNHLTHFSRRSSIEHTAFDRSKWIKARDVSWLDRLITATTSIISAWVSFFFVRDRLRTDTEKLFKDTEGMLDNLIFSNDDRRLKNQKNRFLDELVEAKTIWLKLRRRVDDDDD